MIAACVKLCTDQRTAKAAQGIMSVPPAPHANLNPHPPPPTTSKHIAKLTHHILRSSVRSRTPSGPETAFPSDPEPPISYPPPLSAIQDRRQVAHHGEARCFCDECMVMVCLGVRYDGREVLMELQRRRVRVCHHNPIRHWRSIQSTLATVPPMSSRTLPAHNWSGE